MKPLSDGLTLYHGSYARVSEPDLAKCAKFRYFGQGFYLTTSEEQARSFVCLSLQKAKDAEIVSSERKSGWVSRFTFCGDPSPLRVKTFESADEDWLRCVVAHRREESFPSLVEAHSHYDVMIGEIANDNTNTSITVYISGVLGPLESPKASKACIDLLLLDRLVDQYCFRSMRSLQYLRFEGSEQV